jgi:hypothetical protein
MILNKRVQYWNLAKGIGALTNMEELKLPIQQAVRTIKNVIFIVKAS